MGFGTGKFAHVWKVENKGKYHVAEMSTSKKKGTSDYEKDWSNKFVRLVGTAHEQIENVDISKNVKIGACEVTNSYDKVKNVTYTNYAIFGFEDVESNNNLPVGDGFTGIPDGIDSELPFK